MSEAYEGWALIEQMGFRQTVAKVREVEQFGTKMLRLDVPYFDEGVEQPSGFTTRFAGGQSLYQVSPMDEETALHAARRQADPRPVRPMAFRIEDKRDEPSLPFGAPPGERSEEGDDDPVSEYGDDDEFMGHPVD